MKFLPAESILHEYFLTVLAQLDILLSNKLQNSCPLLTVLAHNLVQDVSQFTLTQTSWTGHSITLQAPQDMIQSVGQSPQVQSAPENSSDTSDTVPD